MSKYSQEILDIVNSSCSHLTAQDIYEILKVKMPNVVLATVYNNLNSLVATNKIKKLSFDNQIDKYDKLTKHDHLVCSKCGKILDLNFRDLTKTIAKECNIEVLGYDLKVNFICDECKKEGK